MPGGPASHPARIVGVVPTLDPGSPRLARLIAAIELLDGTAPDQVLVIANRGRDLPIRDADGTRTAGPFPPWVEVIETGLNLGFAGSIAFGAGLTSFTHLWLLQDDLEPQPTCLVGLLTALDGADGLGAVSPTAVDRNGTVERGRAGGRLGPDGRIDELLPAARVPLDRYVPDADPDFVMSRGLLMRAAAWQDIGGTDARFYPVGWTDVDLCIRLRAAGWTFATTASAVVRHTKAASTPRGLAAIAFDRNGALLSAKIAGAGARAPVHPDIPRELLEIVAQSASALVLELSGADLRAVLRVLRTRLGTLLRTTIRPLRRGGHGSGLVSGRRGAPRRDR